ncbi:MAG: efflux RND transporter periplasmic adaptor subunit [Bacteriovoracia bacterium]
MDKSLLNPKLPLEPKRTLSKWVLLTIVLVIPFLPWTAFTVGSGQVTSINPNERIQTITASVNGFVSNWYIQEGARVETGEIIARIQDVDPGIREKYERELEAARSAVKSAKLMLDTSRVNLERQQKLFEQGLAARKDFEKAKIETSKMEMNYSKALATLTKAEAQLERQLQTVTAPRSGIITRILPGERGRLIKAGTPLAVLTPDIETPAVEIWVDGNDTAMLGRGQKAQVQFEGWPALQVPGWPGIALGIFPAKVHLVDAASSYKGKFRVILVPDGKWPAVKFLKPGIHTKGYISLSESFILREVWRLFTGLPPVIDPFEDEISRLLTPEKKEEK